VVAGEACISLATTLFHCNIITNQAAYETAMDKPLREWVAERYAPAEVISNGRKYVELQVACVDDEEQPYKVILTYTL
jgi:hypothetical protein